jgi:hypothetical protein
MQQRGYSCLSIRPLLLSLTPEAFRSASTSHGSILAVNFFSMDLSSGIEQEIRSNKALSNRKRQNFQQSNVSLKFLLTFRSNVPSCAIFSHIY